MDRLEAGPPRYGGASDPAGGRFAAAPDREPTDTPRQPAEGEADALRTKGEPEATYNAKVAASLTPTLIQQQYLVRWNGQLPQCMLGADNNGLFLQLPGGLPK
jgi:hypothetical protein